MSLGEGSRKQRTIKESVPFIGTALHSGKEVEMKLKPAAAGSGVVFCRVDLPGEPEIKAVPGRVVATNRCTILGRNYRGETVEVRTVEHLLAAIWAAGIDNLRIELVGPEVPITDGSAAPFLELLDGGATTVQQQPRRVLQPAAAVWVRGEAEDSSLGIVPYDGFKVSYVLDYDHPLIGTQFHEFVDGDSSFQEEIARARTFGFFRDIESLHRQGLALGGSLENALVVEQQDFLNQPRFPDEPVRHKVLDVIGDMFLNGYLRGHVIGIKSGHSLNVRLAQRLAREQNRVY